MKGFNIFIVFLLLVLTCQGQELKKEIQTGTIAEIEYRSYGEKIDLVGSISTMEMTKKYQSLSMADTLQLKFSGKVTAVCQAKGCWMKLALTDGSEVMVRFKDYGFFVPKDGTGKFAVVNGTAFVTTLSTQDQKHYAEDAAKVSENTKIITPLKTFGFEANGVLLQN